jgi:hypothetical protein
MKLVNIISAACLVYTVSARTAEPASPEEMVRVCNSLASYVSLAVNASKSKVPLHVAIDKAKASLKNKQEGMAADIAARYGAAVDELYKRVYALSDVRSANHEVIPACAVYSQGQYTAADIQQMKFCEAKTLPYYGFANIRDMGITVDQQLNWLQERGLRNAVRSTEERKRLYGNLSDMIRYVYAHPDLSKYTIYAEQFNSCLKRES